MAARFFLVQSTKMGKIYVPNGHKIYPMPAKYTKWPQNITNGHKIGIPIDRKIYQNLQWQDPPKFTQIVLFGLKINHLATLP
jgi:hypothetical protein